MNHQLSHIFDESTCLTKRQMADYISGAMSQEEIHAAEMHIGSCPFCSEAVDGLMMHKDDAKELLASLNPNFIKEHFHEIMPEVHLNSMAATAAPSSSRRRHKRRSSSSKKPQPVHYLWRVASIAAILAVVFGMIWYFDNGKMHYLQHQQMADNSLPDENGTVVNDEAPVALKTAPVQARAKQPEVAQDTVPASTYHEYTYTGTHKTPDGGVTSEQYADRRRNSNSNNADNSVWGLSANQGNNTQKYTTSSPGNYSGASAQGFNQSQAKARGYFADSSAAPTTNQWQSSNRQMYANSYTPATGNQASYEDNKTGYYDKTPSAPKKDLVVKSAPVVTTESYATKTEQKTVVNAATYSTQDVVTAKKGAASSVARGKEATDKLKQGNIEFDNKNYAEAIRNYASEINSMNKRRRHEALLNSARCYILMGNKPYARMMLQRLLNDNGGEKGEARSMLKDLDK